MFGQDLWAPGLLSCGVHGRATPALLCGHGLWEEFRFIGEGVWEGEQKTGDANTSWMSFCPSDKSASFCRFWGT